MDNLTKMSVEIHKNIEPDTHLEFLYELIEKLREKNRQLIAENEQLRAEITRLKNDTLFGC